MEIFAITIATHIILLILSHGGSELARETKHYRQHEIISLHTVELVSTQN